MRIFAVVLATALILLQYRLWISDQGIGEVTRLKGELSAQAGANRQQLERNRQLAAEVANLKEGMNALEERARSELGMIGNNETFYQVVNGAPVMRAPPPAAPISARTQ
jgi:cell division protein FtsB